MTDAIDSTEPTPELVKELCNLFSEAQNLFNTQKNHTKVINDVFEGRELLKPEVLEKVNTAVMIVYQMTANIQQRVNTLRKQLPEGYRDENGHFWTARTTDLIRETHHDFDSAVKQGKIISGWASVKIDGTKYPN
ncbi:MAG: hypothetical protein M0Q44_14155 [Methylobacter sp.]|jgi:hypothetical protein|nr:hypothetical protein [Methylobacter sp.]